MIAKTNAERQRDFRERRAAERIERKSEGLKEVRGIWAPPDLHDPIRAAASRLMRRKTKEPAP